MNVVAFILAVLSIVAFLVPSVWARRPVAQPEVAHRYWEAIGVGLALLTAAWVVEILTTARQVHF